MESTSFIYVHLPRDLDVGVGGFLWHMFDGNAHYGQEHEYNILLQQFNKEHYLSRDKDVLKSIIQNHDATFKHQVQELHRLYRKQRELMELWPNHSSSHGCSGFSRTPGWHIRDGSQSNPPGLAHDISYRSTYFHKHPAATVQDGIFTNRNIARWYFYLDLPADDECRGNEGVPLKFFFEACKAPEAGDVSSFNFDDRDDRIFIDLNRSVEPSPQCSSHGRNSSVIIDLNSMPVDCFADTITKETPVEHPLADIMVKPDIDLNTELVLEDLDEPSISTPSPSQSAIIQIEPTGDATISGPVSFENDECCPPRGKCKLGDRSQIKRTSLLSELDNAAAETLASIASRVTYDFLYWFAGLVSAVEDDLESEIAIFENDACCADPGRVFSGLEKDLRGAKGPALELKDVRKNSSFLEKSPLRKRMGMKAHAKSRNDSCYMGQRPTSSTLKRGGTSSERRESARELGHDKETNESSE